MPYRTPSIAICGSFLRGDRITGWGQDAVAVPRAYVTALHRAGAQESILAPVAQRGGHVSRLHCFDGLLLAGGQDVEARRYGETSHPCTGEPDRNRDDFELSLACSAIRLGMPVLAICRGMQILNVSRGGSLIQHLPDTSDTMQHRNLDLRSSPTVHDVQIDPGSVLAKALGVERTSVVSQHHQAISRLGTGLRVVAWSDDGVIEGIELEDHWVVGVQWHPELSMHLGDEHLRLFEEFISASCARR